MTRSLWIIAVLLMDWNILLINGHIIYGSHGQHDPVIFPDELKTWSVSVKTGLAMEDKDMVMTSNKANKKPTQLNTKENTIMEMIKVIKDIEGQSSNKDPLMNELMSMMKNENTKPLVTNRNGVAFSSNQLSDPAFDQELKEILSANGIETDLPFDCGRHPKSTSDPLSSKSEPYPWIAALGSREDGRFHYRCVGLIITNNHILTDADCAKSPNINVAQFNVTGFVPEPYAIEAYIVGRRIHPDIGDDDNLLNGDSIGILELANPVPFSEYVQPICLPGLFAKPDPNEIRETDFIVGFDEIEDSPRGRTARLYSWQSRSIGAAACYEAIRQRNQENPDNENMLFKIITKKHICLNRQFRDVGKSVVVRIHPTTGRVTAVGVAAVANAAVDNPIIYSMLQPHRFFVDMVLKKYRENTQTSTVPSSTVPVIS